MTNAHRDGPVYWLVFFSRFRGWDKFLVNAVLLPCNWKRFRCCTMTWFWVQLVLAILKTSQIIMYNRQPAAAAAAKYATLHTHRTYRVCCTRCGLTEKEKLHAMQLTTKIRPKSFICWIVVLQSSSASHGIIIKAMALPTMNPIFSCRHTSQKNRKTNAKCALILRLSFESRKFLVFLDPVCCHLHMHTYTCVCVHSIVVSLGQTWYLYEFIFMTFCTRPCKQFTIRKKFAHSISRQMEVVIFFFCTHSTYV